MVSKRNVNCSSYAYDDKKDGKLKDAIANRPSPTINDMLQAYNGDAPRLAYELTREKYGIPQTDEEITKFQRAYRNELKNVGRYRRGERKPSKDVLGLFNRLGVVIGDLTIHINGCWCYESGKKTDCRFRDVTVTIPSQDVKNFVDTTIDNNSRGYELLGRYLGGMPIGFKSNVVIDVNWS